MKRIGSIAALLLVAAAPAAGASPDIDLASAFGTRTSWRLHIAQGPAVKDVMDEPAPGAINACITRDGGRSCSPSLVDGLVDRPGDGFGDPHYLIAARIVHPSPRQPLLLLQLGSLLGVNGDQRVGTWLFRYDRAADRFAPAYVFRTNHNNNQEVRYLDAGPLQGAVVSAVPTSDAPFAFWITVSRPDAALRYRQVLRYRSATRYNDGNPIKVIDSEMPSIQRRLGVWRPGRPLPVPAACRQPRMVRGELWCDPAAR